MEKDKVLGVITVPVTVENVAEDKKPELPDDIWQQMRDDLQDFCKIKMLKKDCKGFRTDKAECFIININAKEIKEEKVLVANVIMSVFDCNIIAARRLTGTLISYGARNIPINLSKENFLPDVFQNVDKWKTLKEVLRDQTTVRRKDTECKCVSIFPTGPFDICFC